MSEDTLSWKFKAEDQMSGALARINKALGLTNTKLDEAEEKIAKALGAGKAKLTAARADFAKAWAGLFDLGSSLAKGAISSKLGQRVGSILGAIGGRLGSMRDRIAGPLGKAFDGASGIAGRIAGKIGAPLGKAFDAVMGSKMVGRARSVFASIGGVMSGIGSKLGPILGPMASGFKNLLGAAGNFGSVVIAKVGPALKSLGGLAGGAVMGLAAVGAAMGAASVALIGAAGKWAISGLSFKEDTLAAFKTLLGTQSAAERVFKWGAKFAATTPFSTKEVVENTRALLVGGFKENELDTLMKAVGDIGSNMGTDKMNQLVGVLGQIKAKGKLQGDEVLQLTNAGIGTDALKNALGTQLGGKNRAQIDKMLEGGQIKSDVAIKAILETIRTTQSGGKLGSAMEAKSKTLTGLFSSLEDIPQALLFASDTSGLLAPIKKLVSGVIAAFEEGQPLFKKGIAMFEAVGRAWGDAFNSIDGNQIENILGRSIDAIGQFMTAAAPFAKGFFTEMLTQIETILGALGMSSDKASLEESGKTIAQFLGIVVTGAVVLAKALGAIVDAVLWTLEKLGFGKSFVENLSELASIMNGGASDVANQRSIEEFDRKRAELVAYKASRGLPLSAMTSGFDPTGANGGAAGASLSNVGNVAAVNVIVAPDDQEAGEKIANAARGSLIDQLKGFALEFGG